MSKSIPKKEIDISGTELTPGDPSFVLATGIRALNAAATNVTTIYFASPNSIQRTKRKTITSLYESLLPLIVQSPHSRFVFSPKKFSFSPFYCYFGTFVL